MATNVDERIVSAKFDASDFEKGVDKTIKKLDELKKSLNVKQVQKDVKELAEKTEASTDSMGKSLDKLSNRLTTFTGMVKQQILGSLASEVSGIFIRLQNSVTGFIRSISSAQVSAGMSKYQSMLTSVRQMVNAGFDEDKVFDTLERTQTYADETSYSFEQMADAMSKMVAAGVDLDQAGKNVEGIANACANAGINANDASRAFYNLSQAYSSGKLHYTDYRSLELLNLTTDEFKEQMLEAAVAAETLTKKTDKLGNTVYKTTNKKDKKVKANKTVNKKNLSEMLKYDWMNTEAMNYLFGKEYWMEVIDKDELARLRKELGDEEFEKRFGKIATQAYNAAYEARSFVDVVNAIKDSVSSGWSKTFQNLFGKLTEAKDFFTDLANGPLAQVVYDIGEYRNAILGYWNELDYEGKGKGGVLFRQTIMDIADALGILFHTFQQILPGFDEIDETEDENRQTLQSIGKNLYDTTEKIRDFAFHVKEAAQAFNDWMNGSITEDGPTRIELLRKAFSNIGKVLTIVGRLAGIVIQGIFSALDTLSPIIDGVLLVFTKLTEPLGQINRDTKAFSDIEHSINNILTIIRPIAEFLGKILGFTGEIVGFFAQMALDTVTSNIEFFADVLGLLMELIIGKSDQMEKGEGIIARLQADFEGIKNACTDAFNAVKEFFTALFSDLRKLFGLTDEETKETEEGNGIFSGIIHFFDTNEFVQSAKAWIKQAFIDIGDYIKSIPGKIKEFGANLYDIIRGMIFTEKTAYNGSTLETKTVLTPFGEWLDGVIKDVKAFVISIPQKIIDGVGTVVNWIDEIFNQLLGEKPVKDAKKTGKEDAKTNEKMERFDAFISEVTASVKEWFEDLPNKIQKALGNIGNFFSLLWDKIDQLLFGKKVTSVEFYKGSDGKRRANIVTKRIKTGFSKWFDGIIKDISKFIKNIPEYIKAGIKGAGDIISAIVNAIFGKNENEQVDNKTIEDKITAPFLGINLNGVLEKIKDIGITLINQIARIFTGTDDVDKNMEWFSGKVAEGITWVKDKAKEALDTVLKFLVDLPGKIAEVFTGESKDNPEQGKIGKAISDFGAAIGKFLTETLPDNVLKFIDNAVEAFDKIWDKFYKLITGDGDKENEKVTQWAENEFGHPMSYSHRQVKTGWEKFVEKLGNTISHVFEKLPVWVAEGVDLAVRTLNDVIGGIGDWIKSVNLEEEAKKLEERMEGSTDTIADGADKAAENADGEGNRLWEAIKRIGTSLFTLITKTIPAAISEAFTWLGNKGSELWDGFSSIFKGDLPSGEKNGSLFYIGQKVASFIKNDLPGYISTVWLVIKSFATDVWNGISSLFTGEIPKEERAQSIANIISGIKKYIIEDLPKAISDLFASKDAYAVKLNGLPEAAEEYTSEYLNALKRANKNPEKKEAEKSFVESIKDGLLSAFNSIGPTILNGLTTALNWINDIAEIIINAITGEKTIGNQIETLYGKEKPELREALKNIGEALKKLFLESIPKFIGSAIGALAKEAPKWFKNLFSSINKAASDEANKGGIGEGGAGANNFDDSVAAATNILDVIKNVIGEIRTWIGQNNDFLEFLGIIVALTMLFRALSNLFGVADDLEEVAHVIKWGAITIGISAIAGLISLMATLSDPANEKQLENFKGLLDSLKEILTVLAVIVGGSAIGKLFSALDTKWSSGTGRVSLGQKFLGGLSDAFTGFFRSIGITGGIAIGADLLDSAVMTTVDTINGSIVTFADGMDTTGDLIGSFIDRIAGLDRKIGTAIDVVTKIKDLFSIFYGVFDELYTEINGPKNNVEEYHGQYAKHGTQFESQAKSPIDTFDAQKEFFDNLSERLDMFIRMSVFIDNIADAANKLSSVSDLKEKLNDITQVIDSGDLGKFILKLFNALNQSWMDSDISAKSLKSTQYIANARNSGLALGLEMLSSAMSVFTHSLIGLTPADVEAFDKALDSLTKLAIMVDDAKDTLGGQGSLSKVFTGDKTLSKIGSEMRMFGLYCKHFFESIHDMPGFTESEYSDTQRKMESIVALLRQFALAMQDMLHFGTSSELLESLSTALPSFATTVGQFFVNLNRAVPEDITSERANVLTGAVNSMAALLSGIKDLANLLMTYSQLDISKIMDKVFSGTSDDLNSNKLAAMVHVFDEAIVKAMEKDDFAKSYETIGSNIASKLAVGIQSAFDTDPDLKIKITPVLNMSDDTKMALRQQLGESLAFNGNELYTNVAGANDQTEADNVKWADLKASLDSIGIAIAAGPTNAVTVSDMVNAFTGVKVVINKDELVGSITDSLDAKLGELVWNVVNNISNGPGG